MFTEAVVGRLSLDGKQELVSQAVLGCLSLDRGTQELVSQETKNDVLKKFWNIHRKEEGGRAHSRDTGNRQTTEQAQESTQEDQLCGSIL